MRPILAAAVLVVVGCAPSEEQGAPEVASQTQALGTAWLLEIDGQPAGFVSTVTSGSGGAPCGASTLRFKVGPNMSAAARAWLDAALTKTPGQHAGTIWLASNNVKLSFSIATVPSVEFPLAESGNSTQVYFTVNTTGSSSCTAVGSNVMAQKTQVANTFAARYALAKNVVVRLGSKALGDPKKASGVGNVEYDDVTITTSMADSQAMIDWINSVLKKKTIERPEAVIVMPHDQQGVPLVGLLLEGAVLELDAGTPTLPAWVRVNQAHVVAVLPDGGIP